MPFISTIYLCGKCRPRYGAGQAWSGDRELVTRVAEDDTSATRGLELRAQRIRVLPAAFRDPDDEPRGRPPLRVHHQRQPVAQNAVVPAPQLLVGGKHAAFGPGAGKLHAPRSPRWIGLQVATTLRTVEQQLGELDASLSRRRSR